MSLSRAIAKMFAMPANIENETAPAGVVFRFRNPGHNADVEIEILDPPGAPERAFRWREIGSVDWTTETRSSHHLSRWWHDRKRGAAVEAG